MDAEDVITFYRRRTVPPDWLAASIGRSESGTPAWTGQPDRHKAARISLRSIGAAAICFRLRRPARWSLYRWTIADRAGDRPRPV